MRVNRAFAVGRADGPAAGLTLLEGGAGPDVTGYPYVHLVRGALLEDSGRHDEARDALTRARDGARNAAEREQIERRLSALGAAVGG